MLIRCKNISVLAVAVPAHVSGYLTSNVGAGIGAHITNSVQVYVLCLMLKKKVDLFTAQKSSGLNLACQKML